MSESETTSDSNSKVIRGQVKAEGEVCWEKVTLDLSQFSVLKGLKTKKRRFEFDMPEKESVHYFKCEIILLIPFPLIQQLIILRSI